MCQGVLYKHKNPFKRHHGHPYDHALILLMQKEGGLRLSKTYVILEQLIINFSSENGKVGKNVINIRSLL